MAEINDEEAGRRIDETLRGLNIPIARSPCSSPPRLLKDAEEPWSLGDGTRIWVRPFGPQSYEPGSRSYAQIIIQPQDEDATNLAKRFMFDLTKSLQRQGLVASPLGLTIPPTREETLKKTRTFVRALKRHVMMLIGLMVMLILVFSYVGWQAYRHGELTVELIVIMAGGILVIFGYCVWDIRRYLRRRRELEALEGHSL